MSDESVDVLYKIISTLNSFRKWVKREMLSNSVIKYSIFSLYLFNELYNSLKEEKDSSSIIIVPFAELMGVSQQMLFYITCASLLLAMVIQFNFKFNPFNGFNETTVGVLRMFAGSVKPKRLGFINKEQVKQLFKIIELGLNVNEFLNTSVFTVLFWEIMFIISTNFSHNEFNLTMSILNGIFFTIWNNYVFGIEDYIFLAILINIHYFKPKSIHSKKDCQEFQEKIIFKDLEK